MPGPGQGKRSNKKKWCENTLSANIAAVNAVMSTDALTARMEANNPITAPLHTTSIVTTTTTVNTAAIDANDETRIDTATAESSVNDSPQDTQSLTYSHEEVQQLLEDSRLEGWEAGFEEGHKTGRKTGHEEGKEGSYNEGDEEGSRKWMEGYKEGYKARQELDQGKEENAHKRGQLEGYELGTQDGKEEERRKWLAEGHGPGMCVLAQRHTHKNEMSSENGDSKEDNGKHGYSHCVSIEKGHLRLVTEVAKAMASREAKLTTWSDANTHIAPRTEEKSHTNQC
jgi:flagellar biosynthesis/type III secretory pathway protein FliH